MYHILSVKARQIFDSRGFPTLEVDVLVDSGICGRASVPSGASTGVHEALELRDGDSARFMGRGVQQALANINDQISPALIGLNVLDQREIDAVICELDGTENKSHLGANATLAVSLAVAHAAAATYRQPLLRHIGGLQAHILPVPMINILNGGRHADNAVDIQEFMIMPAAAPTFSEALRMGAEIFYHLRHILQARNLSTNVGDEGGFAPALSANEMAIELLLEAIEKAGHVPGKDILLCIDAASTECYDKQAKTYHMNGKTYSSSEMIGFWKEWVEHYPLFSIEDPMAEDDWDGWQQLTKAIGHKVQLVGDDIFVTHPKRLQKGVDKGIANAILIKPNQIGTLSETLDVVHMAQKQGYQTIISHRSGETEDSTIADLAVGTSAGQIKAGSLSRSDRLVKYNQLLRIEEQLKGAKYAGSAVLSLVSKQKRSR